MKPQNIRISDMSDSKVLAMANDCTELSNRDLIDLYLELDHRSHQVRLADDEWFTFLNAIQHIDNELFSRLNQKENEQ